MNKIKKMTVAVILALSPSILTGCLDDTAKKNGSVYVPDTSSEVALLKAKNKVLEDQLRAQTESTSALAAFGQVMVTYFNINAPPSKSSEMNVTSDDGKATMNVEYFFASKTIPGANMGTENGYMKADLTLLSPIGCAPAGTYKFVYTGETTSDGYNLNMYLFGPNAVTAKIIWNTSRDVTHLGPYKKIVPQDEPANIEFLCSGGSENYEFTDGLHSF